MVQAEGRYTVYRSPGLTVLVGDVFDLPERVGEGAFDAVWDRASMVALPPSLRRRYVDVLRQVGRGGRLLLSTFRYDEDVMAGPPFSIPPAEVEAAYPTAQVVASEDHVPPGFAARGHVWFEHRLWAAEL